MPAQSKPQPAAPKDKPVSHVRVGGVRIPIWRNENEGRIYHRAGDPELSYRDKDGKWQRAKSYAPNDLIGLAKAACLAHTQTLAKDREAALGAEPETDAEEAVA